MALTVKKIVNRHGALVSGVTALLVGAVVVVLQLLQYLVGFLSSLSVGQSFGFGLVPLILLAAPFALGYFVSLWILAPIAEELRIPHVVTRSVLATGVGSTVYFIVAAVLGVIGAFAINGSVYSQSLVNALGFDGSSAVGAIASALTGAVLLFINSLPLGILAGISLWLWRKDHPPRKPLSGLIDEV